MKRASEYRAYSEECRTLAKQMEGGHREQLLDMARTWEKLASESADFVRSDPHPHRDGMSEAATRRSDSH
jgi:hypothetical protein